MTKNCRWRGAENVVYVISDGTFLKIGCTRDIERRLWELQTANPRKLKIIKAYETTCSEEDMRLESYLHRRFQDYRIKVGNRATEWFSMKIRYDIDSAVHKLSKNDIRYCFESYATGMASAQLTTDYKELSRKHKKLKCEHESLLNEIHKHYNDASSRFTPEYKALVYEKNELLAKNRQLSIELDAALRRNRTLINKTEEKTKTTTDPNATAKLLINDFPEMLSKHDLEQLFNKPFYEIIDKAAEVGAEINIGLDYFYKRDVLKEALEKGVAF